MVLHQSANSIIQKQGATCVEMQQLGQMFSKCVPACIANDDYWAKMVIRSHPGISAGSICAVFCQFRMRVLQLALALKYTSGKCGISRDPTG